MGPVRFDLRHVAESLRDPSFASRRDASTCRPPPSAPAPNQCRQPSLVLLTLRFDVELLLPAPEFRCALPFEGVPVNRQLVLDGDLITHELPHGRERQLPVLQRHVLELL